MHPDKRSIQIQLYDVFSTRLFGGNVAGVVYADERLDDDAMQQIAAEVPVATTGFVSKLDEGSWRVRFFTPTQEIDMCGHVVVGVFTALVESGALTLWVPTVAKTRAGDIGITITSGADGPLVEMAQLRPEFRAPDIDCGELTKLLGITAEDLHQTLPVKVASTALSHLVVPIRTVAVLGTLEPDYGTTLRRKCFFDLDTWRNYVIAAGFVELTHYYRPSGLPRHKQPWLATVWRKG